MTATNWTPPAPPAALDARVSLPGSKSLTNRELVLAALARGESRLYAPLRARDTTLMARALRALGADIVWDGADLVVRSGVRLDSPATIECGQAGTVLRFLAALALLGEVPITFQVDRQALGRPMRGLTDALTGLGAQVRYGEGSADYLTITGTGGRVPAGVHVEVDAAASSQFLSALCLVAPRLTPAARAVTISPAGPVPSLPHLQMTVRCLTERGVAARLQADGSVTIQPGPIAARSVMVEPDLSNAGPFLAAALVTGGQVRVANWPETTTQAGALWAEILPRLGASVSAGREGALEDTVGRGGELPRKAGELVVRGGEMRAADFDMRQAGELVPTLAAILAHAPAPSTITGIGHLRGHECDRLSALETELRRLGVGATAGEDSLRIEPTPVLGGEDFSNTVVRTYHDHRMVTFGAIMALRRPGLRVEDPAATDKTMPSFVADWETMLTSAGGCR